MLQTGFTVVKNSVSSVHLFLNASLDVLEGLLQEFLLNSGEPCLCGEPVYDLCGLLRSEPHQQHAHQQVVQQDAQETVLLEAEQLPVRLTERVVPAKVLLLNDSSILSCVYLATVHKTVPSNHAPDNIYLATLPRSDNT